MNECKHPRVQIVAREEDAEFVECLECGDIFESSEFKDMMIEDTRLEERILKILPLLRWQGVTKVICRRTFPLFGLITVC